MLVYSIHPDHPLDGITQTILRQFDDACRTLDIDYFLIGATARDIILTHVFGATIYRATRDLDFAVAVPDWSTFHKLKSRFLARSDQWSRTDTLHRLVYRDNGMPAPVPLDLIPFGPIEDPSRTIAWPPDMIVIMSVAGFADAFQAAIDVRVDDSDIRVASIAGLTLLKLFAWADRHPATGPRSKDAEDLMIMLCGYADAGNLDRLYDPNGALPILDACDYDLVAAGAYLLGLDAVAIASEDTRARILTLLSQADKRDQLAQHMARSQTTQENSLTHAGNMLAQFERGLQKGTFATGAKSHAEGPGIGAANE